MLLFDGVTSREASYAWLHVRALLGDVELQHSSTQVERATPLPLAWKIY